MCKNIKNIKIILYIMYSKINKYFIEILGSIFCAYVVYKSIK